MNINYHTNTETTKVFNLEKIGITNAAIFSHPMPFRKDAENKIESFKQSAKTIVLATEKIMNEKDFKNFLVANQISSFFCEFVNEGFGERRMDKEAKLYFSPR